MIKEPAVHSVQFHRKTANVQELQVTSSSIDLKRNNPNAFLMPMANKLKRWTDPLDHNDQSTIAVYKQTSVR